MEEQIYFVLCVVGYRKHRTCSCLWSPEMSKEENVLFQGGTRATEFQGTADIQ
jgi:hypothetical protein